MLISVVIATYNGSKYIIEQLESIMNQSRLPDEILVLDDSSQDNTIDIINRYIMENNITIITLIENSTNLGYALNFWNGLKKAKGDVIFLCDQDDIWLPEKISKLINIMENNRKILALNSSYHLINEKGQIIIDRSKLISKFRGKIKKIKIKGFIKSPRYPGMAMAIRRELLFSVKDIPEKYIYAHDWALNQSASIENGMYFCNLKLTLYRQHGNNSVGTLSSLNGTKMIKHRLDTISDQFNLANIFGEIHKNNKDLRRFTSRVKVVSLKRKKYLLSNNIFGETVLFIIYHRYMSLRCFLGDIYSMIFQKRGD